MSRTKAPFLIQQEFLSPLMCEEVIDSLNVTIPDADVDGRPLMSFRHNDHAEEVIYERFNDLIPTIEQYYSVQHRGTEKMLFEWIPQGAKGRLVCDGSDYVNKKWVRTRDRDLTAVLFLCDYNENASFDADYEVYGGKFEFPNHGFGFNPERGTLVVYPSTPHFLNATAPVLAGDLYQVRIHMATKKPFLYQPTDYPGDFRSWFKDLM